MRKKILIILLALCMLLTAACGQKAQPTPTTVPEEIPDVTLAGKGTEDNPYLIATMDDLLQVAAVMNHSTLCYDYRYSCFQLTADIVLNNCSDFDTWDEKAPKNVWTPIAYNTPFNGVFDGNGHTISGLYIDQPVTKIGSNLMAQFGLFGKNNGEIKNLTIENAYVHPKYVNEMQAPSGGIIAADSNGTISDCTVSGIVISEGNNFGGIAGSNYGVISDCTFTGELIERAGSSGSIGGIAGSSGNISNCTVSARIVCEKTDASYACSSMGGIAGMHSSFAHDSIIENCTFNGEIISGDSAGGIVGHASAGSFKDKSTKAVIRNCTNNGSITAEVDAGGMVGVIMNTYDAAEVWIEGCSNIGTVQSLATDVYAVGGIVGHIDTRKDGLVSITDCTNEAALRANMPGGIVGRVTQQRGNLHIDNCLNKGALIAEGSYAGGILCYIQQWGGDWSLTLNQCVNEVDITTDHNAGGIVCFAYDVDPDASNRTLTISNCINRGNLRSNGDNNYMGGILGVDAMAKVPVNISNCKNEGNLEYTQEVLVDAKTLSGVLFTLSRTSGGIVGYVGAAPYLTVNSGERTLNNISLKDAYLNITNCSSTGKFIHHEAQLADDVSEALIEAWKNRGITNVLNFFISLEGGIVGTIANDANYSVNISGCSYNNVPREIDDWNRFK